VYQTGRHIHAGSQEKEKARLADVMKVTGIFRNPFVIVPKTELKI
jgi:hypothetical protein